MSGGMFSKWVCKGGMDTYSSQTWDLGGWVLIPQIWDIGGKQKETVGKQVVWNAVLFLVMFKVHRKDQSVEDFTSKCLFLLFWLISCTSLIFLIEI